MANEITVVSNLTHAANGSTVTSATTSDVVDDPSTTKRHSLIVQDVGTTSEAASVGDVNTAKQYWIRLRNLSTANFVLVHVTSGGSDVQISRMNPGETWGPCRMKAIAASNPTVKVQADTAACQVEVIACEAEA